MLNALIAVSVVVQFIGQIVALTLLHHKQPELCRPYRQWLYPLPSLIALAGWIYIFYSSGWSAIRLAIIWTFLGVLAYLAWARYEKVWPFASIKVREVFIEREREQAAQEQQASQAG